MHVPQRVIRPQLDASSLTSSASATLPTRHGNFETYVFQETRPAAERSHSPVDGEGAKEHVALVFGDVAQKRAVPVRVHSECMTSEVFGSLKCDCKEQLDAAMAEIARLGFGAILYLRQEGRGIGLTNKIRAYALQSHGHDTVDANRMLGLPDDARRYEVARDMLEYLGVLSVRLMTNNPEKVSALRELGVEVVGRVPVLVAATAHSLGYLEAKRLRMAHDLPPHVLADSASSAPSRRPQHLDVGPPLGVDRPTNGDAE